MINVYPHLVIIHCILVFKYHTLYPIYMYNYYVSFLKRKKKGNIYYLKKKQRPDLFCPERRCFFHMLLLNLISLTTERSYFLLYYSIPSFAGKMNSK
jgi:hypothetical protein